MPPSSAEEDGVRSGAQPSVTVLICTRNRAQSLGRVLASAARMRIPDGLQWEMIVIDNGSSDDTSAVVDAFRGRLPIRRVDEPQAGLSIARNSGVGQARGEHICWTDDDVIIDPDWLAAYAQAFARYPDAAVFGGKVAPVFEVPPPPWFIENETLLGGLVAKRDFGESEAALPTDVQYLPFGANYAVRAREQRQHLYDPQLGVSPERRRLGEETALLSAILADGARAIWVPSAKVDHLIPRHRMTLDYVATYHRSAGETWAYLSDHQGLPVMGENAPQGGRRVRGVPVWVLRHVMRYGVSYVTNRSTRRSAAWLESFCLFNRYRGAAEYWLRESKTRLQ